MAKNDPDKPEDRTATTISYFQMEFAFQSMSYSANLIPISSQKTIDGAAVSEIYTAHNLRWQLYKDADFWFKPSLQIGLIHLGIPNNKLSETSAFSEYLSGYYLTNRFDLNIITVLAGMNYNGDTQKFYPHAILEKPYGSNRYFVEYAFNQVYVGLAAEFAENVWFEFGSKVKASGDHFFPDFSVNVSVINPFMPKPKPEAVVVPVAVDFPAYLQMEKGLLAFYDSQYGQALDHYTQVVAQYPHFGLVHERLGNVNWQLKNFAVAKYHWEKALEYGVADRATILEYLGKIKNREYDEAELLSH